ncbi:GDCCVxC domain-containing (seleno)protein [Parvularcula sp. IMCC14364]|uniref:GDCCVxC domain-containing (seleno)protein n=1 Tax=Parvularcula sp. IMCC14364 TaxID=3067902 RepID=UPI00274131E1|nr:GDCCVxC domain-containing (seleno)protein [Parvularcula sp. IMCC14364]
MDFETHSTLTCPDCGHQSTDQMPTDACQFFYDCKGCGVVLRARKGDCCVYCSYGDVKCPPIQLGDDCCGG